MKYASLELGTVEAIVNKLGGMEGVQRFLRGDSEVVTKVHIINADEDPFVPDGWEVVEHRRGGELRWDTNAIDLHLDEAQRIGRSIGGEALRKKLKDQPVLNACVLDYLLKHPHLIPEEWKGKAVCFWGTIYRNSRGYPVVRFLKADGDGWYYHWLNSQWLVHNLAAVLRK